MKIWFTLDDKKLPPEFAKLEEQGIIISLKRAKRTIAQHFGITQEDLDEMKMEKFMRLLTQALVH